jgi:hypothetical protein
MTTLESPVSTRYLVELYLPRRSEAEIAGNLERLQQAVARVSRPGMPIRHVCSLFIPADETCFHLFEASGPEPVEHALREAGIEHERLSEAVDLDRATCDC